MVAALVLRNKIFTINISKHILDNDIKMVILCADENCSHVAEEKITDGPLRKPQWSFGSHKDKFLHKLSSSRRILVMELVDT